MKSILLLRNTCDALISSGEYDDIQCLALLNWKSLPEVAKEVRSFVIGETRISEFLMGNVRVIHVQPYGYFQVM